MSEPGGLNRAISVIVRLPYWRTAACGRRLVQRVFLQCRMRIQVKIHRVGFVRYELLPGKMNPLDSVILW